MKKIFMLIATITVLLLMHACGNTDLHEDTYENEREDTSHYEEHDDANDDMSIEDVASNEGLTKEDFLYDFDFLMQAMEDTFPYFGVVERRLGVDLRAVGQDARLIIENYPYSFHELANELGIAIESMPEIDSHIFYSIVLHDFFMYFFHFAHATVIPFNAYNLIASYMDTSPLGRFNRSATTNINSFRFYRDQSELFSNISEENIDYIQLLFRFSYEERNELLNDLHPSYDLTPRPPLALTDIIEEGRIAYLGVPSFMHHDLRSDFLADFYMQIQDYEHLIIDIRGNGGGASAIWQWLIMHPLMPDRDAIPNVYTFAFYNDSELGRFLAEAHFESLTRDMRYVPEANRLFAVEDILENNHLPYLNQDDVLGLSYGVKVDMFNQGRQFLTQNIPHIPFNGQIWLLTCNANGSAAAHFAFQAKSTDFAILVGEQVFGAFSSTHRVYMSLPNTGIIVRWDFDYLVDQYGRSLNEFPTTPHYFNREGLDALETVLQMIDEGLY